MTRDRVVIGFQVLIDDLFVEGERAKNRCFFHSPGRFADCLSNCLENCSAGRVIKLVKRWKADVEVLLEFQG